MLWQSSQTTNVCEDCHSTTVWSPVTRVDHTQVIGSCSSCHDGVIATGRNPGHFVSPKECDVCHDTVAWIPHNYRHSGLPYEPLDHSGNFACTRCHQNNSEVVNWPNPSFIPDCAGCHASDFRRKGDHIGGENGTVSQNRNCGNSGCHRISSNEW